MLLLNIISYVVRAHRGSSLSVGVPWVRYYGSYKDLDISLFWPGKDPALVMFISFSGWQCRHNFLCFALELDLIINAGTASVFKVGTAILLFTCITFMVAGKGANVGDIFIISDCAFHDKRIPIPISYDYRITYCCIAYILWKAALVLDFYLYGVGLRKVFETSNLVKELNLQ
ncbi:hypothetical protein HN51_018146, partial [Arachis hypogaea]